MNKLYKDAENVSLNGLTLKDIFKMDKNSMDNKKIIYNGVYTKE